MKDLRELLFVAYTANGEMVAAFAGFTAAVSFAKDYGYELRSRGDGYVYVEIA